MTASDKTRDEGRKANGAGPGGKPDAQTSDAKVKKTGHESARRAGPDGPDARAVGDTFKR